MPADRALDRISRLLDLIPYLSMKEIRLEELSRRLQVDEAQLRRDLEIAFLCGLPGYTPDLLIDLTFDESYIAVSNPQSLNAPRRISDLERTTLLLGLSLLEVRYFDVAKVSSTVQNLRAKLNVGSSEDRNLDEIHGESEEKTPLIENAIAMEERLTFSYMDLTGRITKDRDVSPWRLILRRGQVILRCFDHERDGVREFLVHRMTDLDTREGGYQAEREWKGSEPQRATLVLSSTPMWWRRRNINLIDEISEKDGNFEVRIHFWRRESVLFSLLPIVDHLVGFTADDWTAEDLRHELLRHFRGK